MLRLRRLDRQRGAQRYPGDEYAASGYHLHADLYGRRRHRNSVGIGLGDTRAADIESWGESEHPHQRQQRHAELVIVQCERLHRVRRLGGYQRDQWIAIHRKLDRDEHLHVDLHRRGRQCSTVRDRDCFSIACRADRELERWAECDCKWRQFNADLVID